MKKQILRAFRKTAWKYKHPVLWSVLHLKRIVYFTYSNCPICKIIGEWRIAVIGCKPCPMADLFGDKFGCTKFTSYQKARDFEIKKYFIKRADALLRMVKIMEKWPEERFTYEGWEPTEMELYREW